MNKLDKNIDKVFKNEEVYLDYSLYEHCLFDTCVIVVEKGRFNLKNCEFRSCKLSFFNEAKIITEIILLFYPDAFPTVGFSN